MEEACVTAAELIDEGVAPIISVFAGATKGPVPRLEVAEACENVNEVVGEDVAPHNANALKTPVLATVEDVCGATVVIDEGVAHINAVFAGAIKRPVPGLEVDKACENVTEVVVEEAAPHNAVFANALKIPALATVEDVCEATAEVVDVVASNDGVLALVTSSPLEVVEVENVC